MGGRGLLNRRFYVIVIISLTMMAQWSYITQHASRQAEVWEYEQAAQNLLSGKGMIVHYLKTDYQALIHPMYPFFCAGIYRIFGLSHAAVLFAQTVVFGMTAWLIYCIGKESFGEKTALLAALLVCFHPALFV